MRMWTNWVRIQAIRGNGLQRSTVRVRLLRVAMVTKATAKGKDYL